MGKLLMELRDSVRKDKKIIPVAAEEGADNDLITRDDVFSSLSSLGQESHRRWIQRPPQRNDNQEKAKKRHLG